MRRLSGVVAVAALAALSPLTATACGACDEDRIAATYDHAVVTRAAARGEAMVFCAIEGRFDAAALRAAAGGIRGIRADSVRVSGEPAALSFAVDPKRRSAKAAVDAAQRALGPGARLTIVRVVAPAQTASAHRSPT